MTNVERAERGGRRRAAAVTTGIVVSLLACTMFAQSVWCADVHVGTLRASACQVVYDAPLGLITLSLVIVFVRLSARSFPVGVKGNVQTEAATDRSDA